MPPLMLSRTITVYDASYVYVAEEVKDPERTLPVALATGTTLIIVLYFALKTLGAADPATMYAYERQARTDLGVVRRRNAANGGKTDDLKNAYVHPADIKLPPFIRQAG